MLSLSAAPKHDGEHCPFCLVPLMPVTFWMPSLLYYYYFLLFEIILESHHSLPPFIPSVSSITSPCSLSNSLWCVHAWSVLCVFVCMLVPVHVGVHACRGHVRCLINCLFLRHGFSLNQEHTDWQHWLVNELQGSVCPFSAFYMSEGMQTQDLDLIWWSLYLCLWITQVFEKL